MDVEGGPAAGGHGPCVPFLPCCGVGRMDGGVLCDGNGQVRVARGNVQLTAGGQEVDQRTGSCHQQNDRRLLSITLSTQLYKQQHTFTFIGVDRTHY